MELRDIEYFLAIADHGHVRRAAESLGLSQPALSKSLRRLESSLGAKLVKRTPRGFDFTPVGTALLVRMRGIRLSMDDVAREAADLVQGRAGQLRIGANPATADYLLPAAFEALMKSGLRVKSTVTFAMNDALLPALRAGKLDFIVSGVPAYAYDDLAQELLREEEFVVVAAASHPLVRKRRVMMADLAAQDWALGPPNVLSRQHINRVFETHGLAPPEPVLETNSSMLTLHTVASSELLAFVPRDIFRHARPRMRLATLRVNEMAWRRRLGVSYRKEAYLSPAARRFIEILKTTAKEIATERP